MPKPPTVTVTGNAPLKAEATQITMVGAADSRTNQRLLTLADKRQVVISGLQYSQYNAAAGDYYVEPNEGHPYLTPRSTFLQTYTVSG